MDTTISRGRPASRRAGLVIVAAFLLAGGSAAQAQDTSRKAPAGPAATDTGKARQDTSRAAADSSKPLTPEQLQSLVAPIALYPDDLLAQTLAASTYPLELVQLQQWMEKHPDVKDKALADSVAKQDWDPVTQSMAAVPEVVKRLSEDIQWTTDLGNAFLAQQAQVMDAVQVMRKKAQDKGALKSNEQQKVETKKVEEKQVIVVESKSTEVVYVPSYNPTYVYGPPAYAYYPYPPVYYPPYAAGAAFISFGVGMAWGAAMWGGSCCYAGWGRGGNVYINNNNNFNRNTNINRNTNVNNRSGNRNSWNHNPAHRGGTPYGDRATADRFGGNTRGAGDRAGAGAGNRGGAGGGVGDRSAGAGAGNRGGGNLGSSGAGGDRIGNRDIPSDRGGSGSRSSSSGSSRSSGGSSGFSGGSRGYDGASARASSSRGSSSMGGGGFSRGGGGGMRGGGGGRRR